MTKKKVAFILCVCVVPEPPHVLVLVWEEAVGIIAAVLDVVEAAAVHGACVSSRSRAGEGADELTLCVVVAGAFRARAHAADRHA